MRFSRTDRWGRMPSSFRFSEQKARPRRTAWLRVAEPRRPATDTSPKSARSIPKSSRAVSVRPEPRRPARPTISPARSENSIPSTPPRRPRWRAVRMVSGRGAGAGWSARTSASAAPTGRPSMAATRSRRGSAAVGVGADQAAVAQHRDAVGERVHLVQEMGDKHDPEPLGAQAAQPREQFADLALVQARRRLVQDQQPGAAVERPGDRDHLLHGDGQGAQFGVDRTVDLQGGPGLRGRGGAPRASRSGRPAGAAGRG